MKKILSTLVLGFVLSMLANGQSFSTQVLNKGGIYSNTAKLQDYDNDGDLDIVITSTGGSNGIPVGLYWLENEPTKQFPRHTIVTQNIFRIADVDLADFDGDGDIDYLVSSMASVGSDTDGELVWFQRQPDGTYIKWTVETDADFVMADVADFNADGLPDITAVGLIASNDDARVYINQGNLFFDKITPATDGIYGSVDAEDIDNDGDIDIAVGGSGLYQNDDGARLLINHGNAVFTVGAELHCWGDSYNDCGHKTIEINDINGDGVKDILGFSLTGLGGLYWLDGADNYNQHLIDDDDVIDLGGDFVIFDIDGNGRKDIVRQGHGQDRVSVLYQVGNMVFQREYIEVNWNNGGNPSAKMAVGDLDGDGDLDLVFPEQGNTDGDISWYENINGKLYRHQLYAELKGARIPRFADVDNDGDKDIFLTVSSELGEEEDELILFENLGNNNFFNWRLSDSLDYAADVEPADIDGDGDLDVFVSARDANDLVWLRNDGFKANWNTNLIDANANQVLGIRSSDLDTDGDADVVLCSNNDDKVFWYRNNGTGNFTKLVVDANVDAPREVEAADLDGDGDIDLALASGGTTNSVVIYTNNGSQTFTRQIAFTGKTAFDIEIADWNGDGLQDIIFSISATSPINPQQEVVALINNGGNSFTTTPLVINAEKGSGLKVADLDNDGDMDLVVGRSTQVRARMWLQTPNGLVGTTLSDAGISGSTPQVLGLDVADTNGDGKNEIVFADFARDELVLVSLDCFSGPTLATTVTNAACGLPNGAITVIPTGGTNLSYLWNNGTTTATASNLAPGNYTVTVTANGGCTSTATATITAQSAATISTTKTNATCGNANGTATVNSQNGIGLANFLWSSGATTQTATGLAAGAYTVTVTDVNGCTVTTSVTIIATPIATLTLTPTSTTCGNNDGKVTVSVSGGSPISSYLWSNGATTQNLLNVPGGVYSLTATDGNGCQITGSATVTGLTNPTLDLGADVTFQQGQQAVLDATGPGLTYLWSTGATSPTLTVTAMGTYTVTVTNSSGCTAIDSVVVTVTTSTNNQGHEYNITVSPNPALDIIYLKCEGSTTTSVELFDNLGRLLISDPSFAPDGAIRTMQLEKLPSGTYHIRVSGRDFSRTVSLVKQ